MNTMETLPQQPSTKGGTSSILPSIRLPHAMSLALRAWSFRAIIPIISYIAFIAAPTHASDYYVSVAASANDSNPGTINAPWLSPLKAWTSAQAGDTVYFRAGTYVIGAQIWTKYFGYNGTPTNPIVFRNYPGETVTFNSSVSTVFRIEKAHNHVSGINFTGNASTWFHVSYDLDAPGFQLSDCTAILGSGGDNAGLVYFGTRATESSVRRCRITGPGLLSQGIHGNTAGIILFRTTNVKLLNNEISNVPIGIYYKHANTDSPTDIEIAYNYIHNTDRHSIFLNTNYAHIHDNIIAYNNGSFSVNEANGVTGGNNNIIDHNTVLSTSSINCDDNLGLSNTVTNNIFVYRIEYHRYCSVPHDSRPNYNLYPGGNSIYENRISYALPTWRAYYQGLTGHGSDEASSISGAPVFTGGAAPGTISGFRLAVGSPGVSAAGDGKDMGAETSLVGILSAPPEIAPPSTPMGLDIK